MSRRIIGAGLAIEAILLFAALGPFSLLANGSQLTDMGKLTGNQPSAGIAVALGFIALFAFYGLAVSGARLPGRQTLALALGFTVLFCITLIFVYPAMAIDVYTYAVEGHATAIYGINPYVTSPAQASSDSFNSFAGTWATSTSPYGPVWITLAKFAALLAGPNIVVALLLLKGLGALAVIGTAILLTIALRDCSPQTRALAVVVFGWNPLVLLELVGNGHNDAVLTLFLIAGLVCLAKNRAVLGVVAVGAAVLIKVLPVGVVPLCLLALLLDHTVARWTRAARLALSVAALIAIAVVAYAPYWVGMVTLQRVLDADTDYLASVPALIILLVPGALSWLMIVRLAISGVVGFWQVRSLWLGTTTLPKAALAVLLTTILVATHFAGWYLGLLVAVAVLTQSTRLQFAMVLFTLTATLTSPLWTYVWSPNQDWLTLTTFHLFLVPFTFLPPLLVLFFPTRWWLERSARRLDQRSLSAAVR